MKTLFRDISIYLAIMVWGVVFFFDLLNLLTYFVKGK